MAYEKITLANMASGAAVELFHEELNRVLANIADDNTSPTAKREITLKLTIKPTKTRESATTEIACTSKLAPISPHESFVMFGLNDSGKPEAYQTDPKQHMLDMGDDNITPINQGVNQ